MSEDEHAKWFSPSTVDRWMACGASINANIGKNEGSAAADEGTVAHKLLDTSIKNGRLPARYLGKVVELKFPGIIVNDDMVEAVDTAYAYLQQLIGKSVQHGTESRLDISQTGEFGTADFWALKKLKSGKFALEVVDYKHGRGVPVFANDTKQMWMYALGVLQKINNPKIIASLAFIHVTIVQPRCQQKPEAIDRVRIGVGELVAFGKDVAQRVAAYHAGKINDQYAPGEKQCKWCAKKTTCRARAEFATKGTVAKFADFINPKAKPAVVSTKQIGELSPIEMATLYSRTKMLQDVISGLAKEAMRRLLTAPEMFPGYKLVEGKSSRKWLDASMVKQRFLKLGIDIDSFMPRALVGITEGEKLVPKQKRKMAMEEMTQKPRGQPTIAPVSDSRPQYKPADAASVFEAYTTSED